MGCKEKKSDSDSTANEITKASTLRDSLGPAASGQPAANLQLERVQLIYPTLRGRAARGMQCSPVAENEAKEQVLRLGVNSTLDSTSPVGRPWA